MLINNLIEMSIWLCQVKARKKAKKVTHAEYFTGTQQMKANGRSVCGHFFRGQKWELGNNVVCL